MGNSPLALGSNDPSENFAWSANCFTRNLFSIQHISSDAGSINTQIRGILSKKLSNSFALIVGRGNRISLFIDQKGHRGSLILGANVIEKLHNKKKVINDSGCGGISPTDLYSVRHGMKSSDQSRPVQEVSTKQKRDHPF
jgi:hypothetical protein